MKYKNLNTGAVTDQFSEADWKSGQPQRAGWVEIKKEPKSIPRELIDTVFKKKAEPELKNQAGEIIDGKTEAPGSSPEKVKQPSKTKSNDNPKQKRRAPGKH
jgi:hypothetical protein